MSSRYTSHRAAAEAALNVKMRKGVINMGGDILAAQYSGHAVQAR